MSYYDDYRRDLAEDPSGKAQIADDQWRKGLTLTHCVEGPGGIRLGELHGRPLVAGDPFAQADAQPADIERSLVAAYVPVDGEMRKVFPADDHAGDERTDTADETIEWAQVFYRNAESFTMRDLGIAQAAWAEATKRARATQPPTAPVLENDDALITEAVKRNNVYGVLPNSASTMSIGRAVLAAERARAAQQAATCQPVDMILHCPGCGKQHIDAPETHEITVAEGGVAEIPDWSNPPHRSHLCHGCGHIWRPADVPTNGVAAIKTKGKADSAAPTCQGGAQKADCTDELADMEARKDAAYYERNQVVAALAKCFPSGVAKTAIEGWSEDWHGCVYIDLPTGQVSWHFHDSQAHLFAGLPPYAGKWDGHDTPEKYRRVAALPGAAPVPVAVEDTQDALEPVEGDKLPPVGSKVLIHLGRQDEWVEHTVTGYYAWGDLGGNPHLHRVFVRVKDGDGFDNARLLCDVRPVAAMSSVRALSGKDGE